VRHNTITDYPVGIKCWHYKPCKMERANTGNVIEGNIIGNSGKHAIWFGRDVHANRITGNRITGSDAKTAVVVLEPDNDLVLETRGQSGILVIS